MGKKVIVLLATIAVLAGCKSGSDGGTPSPINKNGDPIISDQFTDEEVVFPNNSPRFVSVVKLKSPALLTTVVKKADGTYAVDEEAKTQVLAEQEAFIAKLKNLSPDIKVLKKYRMALNALSIDAPQNLAADINQMDVALIEADERFNIPSTMEKEISRKAMEKFLNTSMTHIGVDKVRENFKHINANGEEEPLLGQGIKVGIIDTGIDYTHTMMGGSGDPAAYQSVDTNNATDLFPNAKVVGGYDFAGELFNTGSHLYVSKIASPDVNPIDVNGHGTHVAGTVAGLGDGVNTYDGAAPEATLYALKVFGDVRGSTSDSVVIAALEYAADPNGDLNIDDKLDVVNLSLGGGFGKPHNLYAQAIKNIVNAGIVTVAAAGNAGPVSNIVGAPSTSDDAISVASTIDSMLHNWQFEAVEFKSKNNPSLLALKVEGGIAKPISEAGPVSGVLHYIGAADQDLTADVKAKLNGKVALIDRGKVPFVDKFKRAVDAGAIGVVMVNNEAGPAINMGGEENFDIPGVMVTQEIGELIKADATGTDVTVDFVASRPLERPELIDTISGFSSQGPRDLDGAIKPEVSAPGDAIISARVGSGDKAMIIGGTSMATPHVAGVAALLVQGRPNVSAKDIKSLLMNTATLISDADDSNYTISRQGAGLVDAYKAMQTDVIVSKPGISLGKVALAGATNLSETITIKNVGEESVTYRLKAINHIHMQLSLSQTVLHLEPNQEVEINVAVQATAPEMERLELDAFIELSKDGNTVGQIPVLAVANKSTQISAMNLTSMKENPVAGDTVTLTLANTGREAGMGLIFNLIGQDERKDQSEDPFFSVACDLQSAGYRVVSDGEDRFLQLAVKIYNPVTRWRTCDLSVEIDKDGDSQTDIEILGSSGFPGLAQNPFGYVSAIFDAQKLDTIYSDYLKELAKQEEQRPGLDFSPALKAMGPMIAFDNSTIAIIDVPVKELDLKDGKAKFKISTDANLRDVVQRMDTLDVGGKEYVEIDLSAGAESFVDIPEVVQVPAEGSQQIELVKGHGEESLVVYFPRNEYTLDTSMNDSQSQVLDIEPLLRIHNP